jgi:hypothetical protein
MGSRMIYRTADGQLGSGPVGGKRDEISLACDIMTGRLLRS